MLKSGEHRILIAADSNYFNRNTPDTIIIPPIFNTKNTLPDIPTYFVPSSNIPNATPPGAIAIHNPLILPFAIIFANPKNPILSFTGIRIYIHYGADSMALQEIIKELKIDLCILINLESKEKHSRGPSFNNGIPKLVIQDVSEVIIISQTFSETFYEKIKYGALQKAREIPPRFDSADLDAGEKSVIVSLESDIHDAKESQSILCVNNLPESITTKQLLHFFCGVPIHEIILWINKPDIKPCAFLYLESSDINKALKLGGERISGVKIRVEYDFSRVEKMRDLTSRVEKRSVRKSCSVGVLRSWESPPRRKDSFQVGAVWENNSKRDLKAEWDGFKEFSATGKWGSWDVSRSVQKSQHVATKNKYALDNSIWSRRDDESGSGW